MVKPVILILDDEIQVLASIERDLRNHYHSEYRIVKSSSGQEAIDAVNQLKRRAAPLALFLVDQRMPNMSGTEFLNEAKKSYPEAKKVLLTAYADTNAAITSINQVGLDYYLMKPWDPPEQMLYPILDDLLSDWQANTSLPYEGIRVAGTLWSPGSHTIKDYLSRNQIPYQWLDVEIDHQAKELIAGIAPSETKLPLVFFPDGSYLVQPGIREIAEKVGLQTQAAKPFYDLAIIGAGPAGLAAAVYGASEGLSTLIIERDAAGGQAGTSSRIENYLGFPNGLSGVDLTRRAVIQAHRFGVELLNAEEVTGIRAEDSYRFIQLKNGSEVSCHALLIATGVSVRRLEAPGVEALTDAGIYYGAALTEAAFYREQDVFIIGGANSAGQAAIFFSRFARSVSMVIRGGSLEPGMSHYLVEQIQGIASIKIIPNSEVTQVKGTTHLETITLTNRDSGESQDLPAAAMFIFIGAVPRTGILGDLIQRDSAGFILTGPDLKQDAKWPVTWTLKRDPYLLETSCPGIFAAGDVRHGSIKRVGSAVGEGAITIALIHQYLRTV